MTQPTIVNYYLIGNIIRLSSYFVSISNVPVDPDDITLEIKQPDGTVLTYTYAANEIIKVGTGSYYYDFTPTINGIHYYRFSGSGACFAAAEKVFDVQPSAVI